MLALKGLMAEEAMKSNKSYIHVYEWWYDSFDTFVIIFNG